MQHSADFLHNMRKVFIELTRRYYSALKRKQNLTHLWVNLEDIMLSEISQSQKDKYYNSIYMRYLE